MLTSLFLRVFEHLLPRGLAWVLAPVQKQVREFFEGLSALPATVVADLDAVYGDTTPAATRDLPSWERQFQLVDSSLNEAARRERLAANSQNRTSSYRSDSG